MKKRLLKAAITTALTVAFVVPAFASSATDVIGNEPANVSTKTTVNAQVNPFADVPANHWAYAAVNSLVKAGVVDGYGDGTFKGDKTVTRYEMAQIVAKAMNKGVNPAQQALNNQLTKEFATELDAMGIKVDGIQKQLDNAVKISGDARVRYFSTDSVKDYTDYRARVTFDGKISDNLSFNARLSSGSANAEARANGISLDTANVSFKALGLANTVGRQDIKLGTGFMMDTQMNGIASKIGGLKLFGGNASSNNSGAAATEWNRIYGAEYGTNILGAKVNADYLKDVTTDQDFYAVNTSFGLIKGVTANAEYVKNNTSDATATAYGVKLDKLGLSATYRDVDGNAFTNYSTMINPKFDASVTGNGFKGMEYQYDKALDKNANLTVKYQDFENKTDGAKLGARTSAVVNVKF